MSWDEHDDGGQEAYEESLLEEHAVEWVLSNKFDEIEKAVLDNRANQWLSESEPWLELLNIVSQHDKEQLRAWIREGVINNKGGIDGPRREEENEQQSSEEAQVFAIASDVSKFLERLPKEEPGTLFASLKDTEAPKPLKTLSRYAEACNVSEDLDWAEKLIHVVRAFRDLLFGMSSVGGERSLRRALAGPLRKIEEARTEGEPSELVFLGFANKVTRFRRESNPEVTALSTCLSEWMRDYLENYSSYVDLAVCVECGRIFSRTRSDNFYCSKTCQNRVAYKRKKVFESGVLREIEIKESDLEKEGVPKKLKAGVCVYHPRMGLGIIREVISKSSLIQAEVVVRFPQAFIAFNLWQLVGKTSDNKFVFYLVEDPKTFADLL
jgi:hypothetical protein